ncbi:MAG: WG repeat-containing protein [Saprospiraceae bacterium]|nr:WG repeat-containing protein [Saprospiraceae bacterium]
MLNNVLSNVKITALLLILFFMQACEEDRANSKIDQHLADYDPPVNMWGLIDGKGQLVTKPMFDDILSFSSGLAPVNSNGLWGYIDREGDIVIPCKFLDARPFIRDRAIVQNEEGLVGVIDTAGAYVVEPQYDNIEDHGGSWMLATKGDGLIYIDNNGKKAPFEIGQDAMAFTGKRAAVQKNGKWHLINERGEHLGNPADELKLIHGSTFFPFRVDHLWGYMDTMGNATLVPQYQMADRFIDGLAMVIKKDKFILIDTSGAQMVGDTQYILNLGEEWLAIRRDSIWVVRDLDDRSLDRSPWEIHRFHEGRAVVRYGSYWNFIDETGDFLLAGPVYLAWDFHHGQARIIGPGGMGVIDIQGRIKIVPQFNELRDLGIQDRWAYK